ncbi:MAG: hypothetical protein KA419_04075 [Acidobacteria bacterium]|nr:hypothetical protein [Acidobacteriota bacterium]
MPGISERNLHDLFAIAIEEERKAQALYRQAAVLAGADTPLGRMFTQLANDEAAHERTLLADYADFKATWIEQTHI